MRTIRVARRIAVLVVAVVCIVAALLIVFYALNPGVLSRLPTWQLLVPVALIVLPMLALAGWAMDRRSTKKARGL